jgi:hypothetical protein
MTSTPPVSDWSYDALWEKAKSYADRAFEEERESEFFAFWLTLALEFVGRATLARSTMSFWLTRSSRQT